MEKMNYLKRSRPLGMAISQGRSGLPCEFDADLR